MDLGIENCDCQCHDVNYDECNIFNCCGDSGVKKEGFKKPIYREIGRSKPRDDGVFYFKYMERVDE
jgi:hypothetical protein